PPSTTRTTHTLILSARTPEALEQHTDQLATYLHTENPDLTATAHTLALGRQPFPHRRTVTGTTTQNIATALHTRDPATVHTACTTQENTPVIFLFSGQGSQHPGMAQDLYTQEPTFRTTVDLCAQILQPLLHTDIRDLIFTGDTTTLDQTQWAQPALFTIEYALAKLWQHWGITPTAMIGHSLGEWVAACLAEVFTLPDALTLITLRGKLMQHQTPGAMLNVIADRTTLQKALPPELDLAAHNTPRDCVISGPHHAIAAFTTTAHHNGWTTHPVNTTHAFHSALMNPAIEPLTTALANTPLHPPQIPFISNTTGTWITPQQTQNPHYWANHLRTCVEYNTGITTLTTTHPTATLLEIGPSNTLTTLTRRITTNTTLNALPHKRDPRTATQTTHNTLAKLWLTGTTPNWTNHHTNHHRIPLPTYPFQRTPHWLPKHVPQFVAPSPPAPHPLLDECVLRSMEMSVFRTEFAVDRHWVLSEHRLLGAAIVPGTTYLEMARAAAWLHFGQSVTEMRDVVFFVPLLVLDDVPLSTHTTVREVEEGSAEFDVASHDPSTGRWTRHARGVVSIAPLASTPPHQDLVEMRKRYALETVDMRAFQTEHTNMSFGNRWLDSLGLVSVGTLAALGALELPEQFQSECNDYVLHPALLDLATGFSGFAMSENADDRAHARDDRGFFLPVGYDSVRVHGPLPTRATSLIQARLDRGGGAEVRTVDVTVYDDSGQVALEIIGFTTKRVSDARRTVAQLLTHPRHHVLRWVPSPPVPLGVDQYARVLVVGEPRGMGRELSSSLRKSGHSVIEVELATTWQVNGADSYRTPPTAEGFARVLDTLGEQAPDLVVHVAAPAEGGTPSELEPLKALLDNGVHSLFHLTKALSDRSAMPARIGVVAPKVARVTGHETTTVAAHATLFGLAKVIGLESPDTHVCCVDIDEHTTTVSVSAELLGPGTPAAVALRNGTRYVAELGPIDLHAQPRAAHAGLDDVYLITGGLGGLGLAVARHLSRTRPGVRLALLGRTPRRAEAAIRELEDGGACVRVYYCDVTDLAGMSVVIKQVETDMGHIGCVVHAAGVAGNGFIFRKDHQVFRETLAPKILGAVILDLVTQDNPPELMLNFGSTVSVFGAAGQGDYTAANSFLDHFAEERTARGRRTMTARWSDWIDVGMAFDHGVEHDAGFFRSLSVEDGLSSFDEILAADTTAVIVGEINYPRLHRPGGSPLPDLLRHAPLVLATSIADAASRGYETPARTTAEDGLTLLGKPDSDYSIYERILAGIWAVELGLSELSVHDNSFALGMDSLSALRVAQQIQKAMDVRISMADMFRFASIAQLAAHLGNQLTEHSSVQER
ncbi:SDR family NAD(P)-dependent oxidoreductase, partial [Rhodococcus erythropolis]|nr:SDR family NAD(P)-dependent oxidoreductase [Rhodococcus erythropolis]